MTSKSAAGGRIWTPNMEEAHTTAPPVSTTRFIMQVSATALGMAATLAAMVAVLTLH